MDKQELMLFFPEDKLPLQGNNTGDKFISLEDCTLRQVDPEDMLSINNANNCVHFETNSDDPTELVMHVTLPTGIRIFVYDDEGDRTEIYIYKGIYIRRPDACIREKPDQYGG